MLAIITAVNLRGIATSARSFMLPNALFVVSVLTVIAVGLTRQERAWAPDAATDIAQPTAAVGALLALRAFSNGCASLTGVEAIADAVPSFRSPAVRRAQQTVVLLGLLLGTMLIGLALLIEKYMIYPVPGMTILAQITASSLGQGPLFYVVQIATMVLLALAANTSFGAFPVLAQILAKDSFLPPPVRIAGAPPGLPIRRPGAFRDRRAAADLRPGQDEHARAAVRGRRVHRLHHRPGRHGPPLAGTPRPSMAGQGSAQRVRGDADRRRLDRHSGQQIHPWSVARRGGVLSALVALFWKVSRSYRAIENWRHSGWAPRLDETGTPGHTSVVIVPVNRVSELSRSALQAALSLDVRVVAAHVAYADEPEARERFQEDWQRWHPGIELVILQSADRDVAAPMVRFVNEVLGLHHVFVLIAETDPGRWWAQVLVNKWASKLERRLRCKTRGVICHARYPVPRDR